MNPQIALIGVGKYNIFGHPNPEVLNRLESMGTQIFRTDENGEITIKIGIEGKIKIKNTFATKDSCKKERKVV